MESTGCCERFDPTPWRDALVHWTDKPFLTAEVPALYHVPIGVGRVASEASAAIKAAKAEPPEQLMLADETSPWKTRLLIAVTGEVPGWPITRLSGTFFTKVFDGPFRKVGGWLRETAREAKLRGHAVETMYEAWTTCPSCAKAYGHNYVVVLAKLDEAGAEREAPAHAG